VGKMSETEEIAEVMKRIEDTMAKAPRHFVKGTMLVKGEEIVRSTLDNTTSEAIKTHFLGTFKNMCHYLVTEHDPTNKLEFIRIDFKEKEGSKTTSYQIGMTTEGDCDALYMQEYRTRDLRVRNHTEQRDVNGYLYIQRNPFNPTQD
jgi:hypothetical protein